MMRRTFLLLSASLIFSLTLGLGTAFAEEGNLAIKGFDPVAYFTDGKPTPGDPQYQHEWDGAVYRFASAEHLELFKSDPERYAPQHGNYCTVAMSRGKKVFADPNSWLIHEGRLYLFGGPAGRDAMLADPAEVQKQADAKQQAVLQLPDPVQQ
jgi:YHS domain-containing protein